ncbi:ATP-binding cassette domain-containing protein [Saccharopolyspora sp. NFXS83]|uniref:ABC transporter ATP-binding protein n=1 Tax=Saccharopolyspora sp. NFXS83 TaxID=2993560 RepID=UPI00224A55FC|nr:ATP-binding cassette domain-containing protein [Saccharopolyspora sp. NFXS83]MCX2734271.1 ATP-binding cassette domain-containing protein [Saccharopolyspora sp. NFXS83]
MRRLRRDDDRHAPADAPAVLVRDVHKSYRGVHAVRGVDITVRRGETFGFLGPNGAGKSTMIAMMCTLARPDSGRIEIAGYDVVRDGHQVRRRLGLVFQESTLDTDLTTAENLSFHADLYGMPRAVVAERVESMLDLVGLRERRGDRVATFSGGMRRRLEIARGLLHRPRVLFLDEPTVGLDPQTRAEIWTYLHRIAEQEATTVFLTTHYLDEAEQCDRIAIIDEGRIVAQGTPAELKSVLGADRIALRTDDDAAAVRVLRDRFDLDATVLDGGVQVQVADGARFVPVLCSGLNVPIFEVTVTRPSLDEVFLHYTGRAIRDAPGVPAR